MSNEEILIKAMNKSEENGWRRTVGTATIKVAAAEGDLHLEWMARGFIFNHDFAKALWGDYRTCFHCGSQKVDAGTIETEWGLENTASCNGCGWESMDKAEFPEEGNEIPAWQYHLQQMVIADYPIQYLGNHLPS